MANKWIDRLSKAVKRGKFTNDDIKRAGDWSRCAVGEKHRTFPKVVVMLHNKSEYGPIDETLDQLGIDFAIAVETNNIPDAITTFYSINTHVKNMKGTQ